MSGDVKNNMKCYICNSRAAVSMRNAVQIFSDQNKLQLSSKSLSTAISEITGIILSKHDVHSSIICKKCFKLFTEHDELEHRLNEIKAELSLQFRKTYILYQPIKSELDMDISNLTSSFENDNAEVFQETKSESDPLSIENAGNATVVKKKAPSNIFIIGLDGKKINIQKHKQPSILKNVAKTTIDTEHNLNPSESTFVMEHNINNVQVVLSEDLLENEDDNMIDSSNNVEIQTILTDNIEEGDEFLDFEIENEDETHTKLSENSSILIKKILVENPKTDGSQDVCILQENDIQEENTEDLFECMLCTKLPDCNGGNSGGIIIGDSKTMIEHMKTKHNIKIHMCDLCGGFFKNHLDVLRHKQEEHSPTEPDGSFKCTTCSKTFSSYNSMKNHRRSSHPKEESEKNNRCNDIVFDEEITHVGIRPYHCDICEKGFTSKYTYQSHLKTHTTRQRPFTCSQCGKSFFTVQNLSQHEKTHLGIKDYVCNICGKAFGTQHNLEVHGVVHSGCKPFSCKVCGKSFARRAEIRDHERIHTGEKPFICEICSARFSQRSNLQSHRRATHLNEKKHKCSMCERTFKRKRLLDYHLKAAHTGERPYKCDSCGATFIYPEHFKKHMKIHTGVKPFTCEVCGKKFNSRDNRNAHRFVHSDKKPFECLKCGAGFMRKPLLYAHMHSQGHISDKIVVNQPRMDQQSSSKSENETFIFDNEEEIITSVKGKSLVNSLSKNNHLKEENSEGESDYDKNLNDDSNVTKLVIECDRDGNAHIVQDCNDTLLSKMVGTSKMMSENFKTQEQCESIIATNNVVLNSECMEIIDQPGEQIIQGPNGPIKIMQLKLAGGVKHWVAVSSNPTLYS